MKETGNSFRRRGVHFDTTPFISNYTAKDDLEQILEDKWVNWRIEDMKDDLREDCEERITAELGRQKQLNEFGVDLPEIKLENESYNYPQQIEDYPLLRRELLLVLAYFPE